jgi:uncharacterized protein
MNLYEKLDMLKFNLSIMDNLAVAYSGGVDSTFLLAVSKEADVGRLLAVTVNTPLMPAAELKDASDFALKYGIRHEVLNINPLGIREVKQNMPDRCYFCKKHIFSDIIRCAGKYGISNVADGANLDDESDYRPGMKASGELGVLSPLRDAGFTKNDIRELSRKMGLSIWNKPSFACLASRFPYGTELTEAGLKMVEQAEGYLKGIGFSQVRVRCHGDTARIEVLREEHYKFLEQDLSYRVNEALKRIGFGYVSLDLQGYRTGSMNEGLEGIK